MGISVAKAVPELEDWVSRLRNEIHQSGRPKYMRVFPASIVVDGAFLREGCFACATLPLYDAHMDIIAVYISAANYTRTTLETRRTETLASMSAAADRSAKLENTSERVA